MTKEELNEALYRKLNRELDQFRESFLALPQDELLNRAYEYVVRQDIVSAMEYVDLDKKDAQALLNSPNPLDDIFAEFEERNIGYTEILQDCAAVCAKDAERRFQRHSEETRNAPLYPYSLEYARDHGESARYYASREANLLCKEAIEAAVLDYFDGKNVHPEAVRQVVNRFPYKRVFYVLAVTVQLSEWDTFYSAENKAWARTVQVAFDEMPMMQGNRNTEYIIEANTVNLNDFITMAREQFARDHPLAPEEVTAEAQRILDALQAEQEPNSPHRTHYMAEVRPEFLQKASSMDRDRLLRLLPFKTTTLTPLVGEPGMYVLISAEENRTSKQELRRPRTPAKKKKQEKKPER
ncbi:MAG: DUF3849 domain-containing protein [Oscillibacter sp.]|nr:DUF3849 domain-containing protein [Oscillibacter sp.]